MTKRVKLLSVMVAAVLCFTAGLALLFGSNNTAKAEDAIPEVTAPTVASKTYAAAGSVKFQNAEAATGDWIFVKMTVIKGTKGSRGSDNNGFISTISTDKTISHVSGDTYKGYLHNVEPLGVSFFEAAFTAAEADKVVTFAVNLTNGELSVSTGDGYTTAAKYAGIEAIEGGKYYAFITNSSKIQGFVKDVVCYDENGTDLGLWTNMEEAAPIVDASGIAGKSYGATSSFWVASATATTSNWIILEWDNGEGNTTARTGGGWTYGVAIGDETLNSVTATADNIWHDFGGDYFGAKSAGKHVKITVDTTTGKITGFIDGVANDSATRPVDGLANFKFRAGVNSSYTCNSLIHNFKAYDAEGNDLGVETNMAEQTAEIVSLNSINTSSVSAYDYAVPSTASLFNATATESDWIIFEWTNDAENSVVAGGGHMFSYGLGATQQNTELVSVTDRTQLLTKAGTIRVAFETATGKIYRAFNSDVWTACPEGTVNKDSETGALFAGILWNNGNVTKGKVYGLKCYDENGNDLGIAGNFVRVYEGRVVDILDNLGANEVGGGRYIGHIYFKDTEGNDIPGFCLGSFPAKKYGTEEVTLNFSPVDGSHQLFSPASNGKTGAVHDGWEWSDYDNEWYVVEAGTVFANAITLAEDMIIRIHGSSMQLFNASTEFAITYAGVDGKENPNTTTTRTFDEAVAITAIDDPLFIGWDVAEIPAYTYGDVTVTANWVEAQWIDYNLTISEDLSLSFNVRNVGSVGLTAIFTMDIDGENKIEETVSMHHYSNEIPGKIIYVNFTFDKILPQHLGDNINVKIMYGDIQMLEMDVTVKEYLDGIIAGDTASEEEKALAQDLLYYGAAAQLYTGHDVENLPADLDGVSADLPEDLSVYAKDGVKDAEYYWKKAEVVYDNTVSLVLTFAAPADLDTLVVTVVNAGVSTDVVAEQVSAGIYEVSIALPATQFGNALTLTIKDGGEAKGQVLTYSVNSYIAEVETADTAYITLLERLYCYGASANKFANLDA